MKKSTIKPVHRIEAKKVDKAPKLSTKEAKKPNKATDNVKTNVNTCIKGFQFSKNEIFIPRSQWRHLNYNLSTILENEKAKNFLKLAKMSVFVMKNTNKLVSRIKTKVLAKIKSKMVNKFVCSGIEAHESNSANPFIHLLSYAKKFTYLPKMMILDVFLLSYKYLRRCRYIKYLILNIQPSIENFKALSRLISNSKLKYLSLNPNQDFDDKNSATIKVLELLGNKLQTSQLEGFSFLVSKPLITFVNQIFCSKFAFCRDIAFFTKQKVIYPMIIFENFAKLLQKHLRLESLKLHFDKEIKIKHEILEQIYIAISNMSVLNFFHFASIEDSNISRLYSHLSKVISLEVLNLEVNGSAYKTIDSINSLDKLIKIKDLQIKLFSFNEYPTFQNLIAFLQKLEALERVSFDFKTIGASNNKDTAIALGFIGGIKSPSLQYFKMTIEKGSISEKGYFEMIQVLSTFKNLKNLYLNLIGNSLILNSSIKKSLKFYLAFENLNNIHLDLGARKTFCFSGVLTKSEIKTEQQHEAYMKEINALKIETEHFFKSILKIKLLYLDFHPKTYFDS